jgi:hypothetical protein
MKMFYALVFLLCAIPARSQVQPIFWDANAGVPLNGHLRYLPIEEHTYTEPIHKWPTQDYRAVVELSGSADQALGYHLPVVTLTANGEIPLGNRIEIDAGSSFSSARKYNASGGLEVSMEATGIFWATRWFGLTGDFGYERLRNNLYSKGGFFENPGIVFRAYPLRLPSRLWLNGIVPTGSIDKHTGIESNRETGVHFTWETLMGSLGPGNVRMSIGIGYFHGYNQGNPVCDGTYSGPVTCPRTSWNAGNVTVGIAYAFPKTRDNEVW